MEKKVEILKVFFSGCLAWILAYALKFLFHTLRPFDVISQVHSLIPESGFAFPSGHATFFMALAVSIFFLHKKAGYVFMFFALLIGLARIMAGVHFPIDILVGFVLGGIVSCLVAFFTKNV
jgi:undecaprenyl-diphosphatase